MDFRKRDLLICQRPRQTWYRAPRRICLIVAALVMLAALSGCGGASPAGVPPATPTAVPVPATATKTAPPTPTATTELRSGKVRSDPTVGAADLAELVRGNNAFAFDLYHALSGREGNLFYSPFSVSQALAMTYAGARGETELQMADTLHYRLPQSGLHPAFNKLDRTLAPRGQSQGASLTATVKATGISA